MAFGDDIFSFGGGDKHVSPKNSTNDNFNKTNTISNSNVVQKKLKKDISDNKTIRQYQQSSRAICIKVHNKSKSGLDFEMKRLMSKYPQLGLEAKSAEDFFNEIISKEFEDGFPKTVFIRNNTLDDSPGYRRVTIRPKRLTNDYFSHFLPENKTLLLKGNISGNYFYVESVFEDYNEDVLPYEVECLIKRYDDELRVSSEGGNFLYDFVDNVLSINEHTRKRLDDWKSYIKWRRTIIKKRMHGAHYVSVKCEDGNLAFTLRFKNHDVYKSELKWIRFGELAAYDGKEYSDEQGNFKYNDEDLSRRNEKLQPLGRFIRSRDKGINKKGDYEVEIVYSVPDNEFLEEIDDVSRDEYIQNQILPLYSPTGFLAPLVIKDLSLLTRFERTIKSLCLDRGCHSPNLPMWIFDVTKARSPKSNDRQYWEEQLKDNWLNKGIATNTNQREAIFKMLEAPDLCIIQGPPGTGKTTVIAEAIYQLVRDGQRVLLASQSHDAVDNALDRLENCSEIRAIRLSEREKFLDEDRSKYGESYVLSSYYNTLSKSIFDKYLEPWNNNRLAYLTCQKELRDFKHLADDLEQLKQAVTSIESKIEKGKHDLKNLEKRLKVAVEENEQYKNDKRQYDLFCDIVKNDELSSKDFFIPSSVTNIVVSIFAQFIRTASGQGIIFSQYLNEDMIERDPALSLFTIDSSCRTLFSLRDKLKKREKNAHTDMNFYKLMKQKIETQIQEIRKQISEEKDAEKWKELDEKRKNLRNERENLKEHSMLVLSDSELSLFDEEGKNKLQTSEGRQFILGVISNIETEYRKSLDNTLIEMKKIIENLSFNDIESMSERKKVIQGNINHLDEERKTKLKEIKNKNNLVESLEKKYKCDQSEIESCIQNYMKMLKNEWDNQEPILKVWQEPLKKFAELLKDPVTSKYDKEYFYDIYLSSVNVVGITCNANMRKLDEIFYDFDVVIIDEVSKATPPELLQPLMKARKTILVGDHRQLPPVFNEYEKNYNELLSEIKNEDQGDKEEVSSEIALREEDLNKYRKMVTSTMFKEYFENADKKIKHSLLTQYRMHSDIQKVINRFYDGKLKSGIKNEENKTKDHGLSITTEKGSFLRPDCHAYWVDSSKLNGTLMEQTSYSGSTSFRNIYERYIILSILSKINDAYLSKGQLGVTVGVISFYGSQVGDLRKSINQLRKDGKLKALKVDVNTVDRFQGKEKQIIITSLVCNKKSSHISRHVASFERINVAFSRAQNLLIIVGAKDLYARLKVPIPNMETGENRTSRIYQEIIDDISRNGALISGETLISSQDEQKIKKEYKREEK